MRERERKRERVGWRRVVERVRMGCGRGVGGSRSHIMKDEETVTQINLPEQRIMETKLKILFFY